jgi:hypothetical protein
VPKPLRKDEMKHLSGTVIAALTLSHAAAAREPASELPYYDTGNYCHRQSDILDRDPTLLKVCLELEQKPYDRLKKRWPSLDKSVKDNCQTALDVSGSYYKLMDCGKAGVEGRRRTA